MTSTDHDTEASRKFVAAVHGVSAAADEYLNACRAAHIRTLADLDRARQGNTDLRQEIEGKDDDLAALGDQLEALSEVRVERDQLRETVADLEGQLAIARAGHTPAPEPPASPPAPAKPRNAPARRSREAVSAAEPQPGTGGGLEASKPSTARPATRKPATS